MVIWFPRWAPVWSNGWDINATILFFYSSTPRTSCLDSLVTRYQIGIEDARCQSGTEDARYQSGTEDARYQSGTEDTHYQSGTEDARYQSGTEDARCQGGTTEVARYHRPFEARSVNSTRRETFQQLAACSSSPHSGWFAPLSVPPGSPADLAPVSEPMGGTKPRETRKPCRMRH